MPRTHLTLFTLATILISLGFAQDVQNNRTAFIESLKGKEREIGTRFPKDFYLAAHGYLTQSKLFKNFNLTDSINIIDNVDDFKPPKELFDNFPYYMSGYDHEDRPVWIVEIGKYNARNVVEKGQEAIDNLEKYALQAAIRVMESIQEQKHKGKDVKDIFIIGDWEGLEYSQVAHLPTAIFTLNLFRRYADILTTAMGQIVAINVSYPVELAFNIGRPFLGGLFAKTSIFGTNKVKWSSELRRLLPEESIPTWYGGRKDFKPVKFFG